MEICMQVLHSSLFSRTRTKTGHVRISLLIIYVTSNSFKLFITSETKLFNETHEESKEHIGWWVPTPGPSSARFHTQRRWSGNEFKKKGGLWLHRIPMLVYKFQFLWSVYPKKGGGWLWWQRKRTAMVLALKHLASLNHSTNPGGARLHTQWRRHTNEFGKKRGVSSIVGDCILHNNEVETRLDRTPMIVFKDKFLLWCIYLKRCAKCLWWRRKSTVMVFSQKHLASLNYSIRGLFVLKWSRQS